MANSPIVYIVDDDAAARKSLCALVKSRKLDCMGFASAEDFLSEVPEHAYGVLITDLNMEGMTGVELQQVIADRGYTLPTIVVSGYADVPVTVRVMERGAVTLLQKPYDAEVLLGALDRTLQFLKTQHEQTQQSRTVGERLALLSSDEQEMLEHMMQGKLNKQIARLLNTSVRTVNRRRRSVLDKMQAESVPELAKLLAGHQHALRGPTKNVGAVVHGKDQ